MEGWIKLYRKLSDKAFYSKDSEKVHLWVHLLIKATHKGNEEMLGGKPIYCKSGQFTTGRKQLSLETGISESKIERILEFFAKIEQQIETLILLIKAQSDDVKKIIKKVFFCIFFFTHP
jgi:hypothetical protein